MTPMSPFTTLHSLTSGGWIWLIFLVPFLFFIFRELLTWYWKVNRAIELLEKIEENTRKEPITTKTN
jgi:hypothetical protein